MDWLTVAVTLFLIIDPLGNTPVFLAVLKHVTPERRQFIIIRELLIAFAVMCLFFFSGRSVLKILGLSREAVAIAGAIVLFIIAIRMIFPSRGGNVLGDDEHNDEEPLIVPLAIPLTAGPSLLATLILLVENDPGHLGKNFLAMFTAWLVSSFILLAAPFFYRILGNRGLKAAERLMGMILISISVQMFLNAIQTIRL
ncbi:YhgN family NAAT transporter [Suttonella ornithocola]|uniref:UPF0056 membrane protein n=1 Tax=Suttonella ornithocola TaxID=279832 RepID=A0A380MRJ4_9GAMM|nr:YhgN family NAAT transporter [Suttonella ornithocola]SUO94908.1 putative antibiotic transporter [Suttonella ornithocola]